MFTVICTFLLGPFLTMLFIWYKMLSHMCGRGYGLAVTSGLLVWRWRQCCWCCGDVSAAGVAVTSVLLVLRWRQCCWCGGDVSAACVAVTSVLLVLRWRQCCWCCGDVSAACVALTSVLLESNNQTWRFIFKDKCTPFHFFNLFSWMVRLFYGNTCLRLMYVKSGICVYYVYGQIRESHFQTWHAWLYWLTKSNLKESR